MKKLILLCLVSSVIFVACKQEVEEKEKIRPVKMIKVGELADFTSAKFPGVSEELQLSEMGFKVAGPLVKLNAYEGKPVKKGELLAEIDPRDFKVDLTAKEGRYIQARAEKERYATLLVNKSVSKNEYDQKLAAYLEAKAAYNAAQNALVDTKLKAPFDGFIDKKYVENYERIRVGQPIVSLLDLSATEIKFAIPEMIAIQYRQFSEFLVSFDIYPDKVFTTTLKEIEKKSVGSAGIPVTLVLDHKTTKSSKYKILPGLSCSVKIVLDEGKDKVDSNTDLGILVPLSSVYEAPDSDTKFVWVINSESMIVNKREVSTGVLAGKDLIYIISGIESGEQIVAAGGNLLTENMKVKYLNSKK